MNLIPDAAVSPKKKPPLRVEFRKTRALFLLPLVLVCLFWHCHEAKERARLLDVGVPAAICAAETLEGYEFDGAERLSDGRWRLYRREPGAMGTRRVTVAVLRLPEGAAAVAEHFRDMRPLRGGVFFATYFSWDTEWSGVYVAASIDEDLRPYCAAELGEGAWYLAFVPFGFN